MCAYVPQQQDFLQHQQIKREQGCIYDKVIIRLINIFGPRNFSIEYSAIPKKFMLFP